MPFRLLDARSTFQRTGNSIFQDPIAKGVVLVYRDDILVHIESWTQHKQVLHLFLQIIQKFNLQLQVKKCCWGCTELRFLGYIVSATGVQMDLKMINAITQFSQPSSVRSLQIFLGLVNFSLKFHPNLASVTYPLRPLLNKHTKFVWSDQCQESFSQQKEMVRNTPIFAHPNFNKLFVLQTDASNYGIGALRLQQEGESWRPVAFISRSLTKRSRTIQPQKKSY